MRVLPLLGKEINFLKDEKTRKRWNDVFEKKKIPRRRVPCNTNEDNQLFFFFSFFYVHVNVILGVHSQMQPFRAAGKAGDVQRPGSITGLDDSARVYSTAVCDCTKVRGGKKLIFRSQCDNGLRAGTGL